MSVDSLYLKRVSVEVVTHWNDEINRGKTHAIYCKVAESNFG